MNDNLIIMVGIENICRLCLRSTGAMSDIFETTGEKSLQQQILCITGLATKVSDDLPSKICHRCRHIVEEAYELREVVKNSCKILAKTREGGVAYTENHESLVPEVTILDDDDEEIIIQETQETIDMTHGSDSEKENYEENDFHDYTENAEDSNVSMLPVPVPRNQGGKRPHPSLVCQLCLDQFATVDDVRIHAEAHYAGSDLQIYLDLNSRPFVCTFCDEVQLNKPQLVRHHRRHLGVNPYACKEPGCSYVGKDRDGIRHHRVIHAEKCHVCGACGARFRRRAELAQHARRAHAAAPPPAACAACALQPGTQRALHQHMRAHHYAPRFPCPYGSCSRAYGSARALRDHRRAHADGARHYRCPRCNATDFRSTSSLKHHMKEHDRSSLIKCSECPARLEQAAALRRHRAAHHPPHHPHPCLLCPLGYDTELELAEHESTCVEVKRLLEHELQQNGQTDTQDDTQDDIQDDTQDDTQTDTQSEEPAQEMEPDDEDDDVQRNRDEHYLRPRSKRLREKAAREALYLEIQQDGTDEE